MKIIKLLFLYLFTFFAAQVFGQESNISKVTSPNLSTESWNFICENYALTGITKVQITKTNKGGILKLTVETTDPTYTIEGNVYVDLTDNTVLICTDKNNRSVNGNEISSNYYFSNIEMNKLKKTDIKTIRYNIKGNNKGFGSQTGNFTALNQKKYFSTSFDKTKKEYDTALEISSLYK